MRTRYFHEDDYCQQELLPVDQWEHCAAELAKIGAFSEAHRVEHGWSQMYLRGAPPRSLRDMAIPAASIADAVSVVLPRYDAVTSGYSSYVEDCRGVDAFGHDHGFALFVE